MRLWLIVCISLFVSTCKSVDKKADLLATTENMPECGPSNTAKSVDSPAIAKFKTIRSHIVNQQYLEYFSPHLTVKDSDKSISLQCKHGDFFILAGWDMKTTYLKALIIGFKSASVTSDQMSALLFLKDLNDRTLFLNNFKTKGAVLASSDENKRIMWVIPGPDVSPRILDADKEIMGRLASRIKNGIIEQAH